MGFPLSLGSSMGRRRMSLQKREAVAGILFALPAMLGFFFWAAGPMVAAALISLTDWGLLSAPHFLGLGNYIGDVSNTQPYPGVVHDSLFWQSLRVTTYYTLTAVPGGLLASFLVALLLSRPMRGVGIFRAIYYLPAILPVVATSIIWLWLFNPDAGLLNVILNAFGLPQSSWVSSESTAIPSLVIVSIWASGGSMLIYIAAIKGVPRHLYEAAEIDGANVLVRLWYITIPTISPVILFTFLTGFIASFSAGFTQSLILTQGGPNNATLFYALYVYRQAFQDQHMGYASALSWTLFVLLLAFTLMALRLSRPFVPYEAGGTQ